MKNRPFGLAFFFGLVSVAVAIWLKTAMNQVDTRNDSILLEFQFLEDTTEVRRFFPADGTHDDALAHLSSAYSLDNSFAVAYSVFLALFFISAAQQSRRPFWWIFVAASLAAGFFDILNNNELICLLRQIRPEGIAYARFEELHLWSTLQNTPAFSLVLLGSGLFWWQTGNRWWRLASVVPFAGLMLGLIVAVLDLADPDLGPTDVWREAYSITGLFVFYFLLLLFCILYKKRE